MRKMKKMFTVAVFTSLTLATFSANAFTMFTTIAQAEQYCPAVNTLTYNAFNPHIGTVSGSFNGVQFRSSNAVGQEYVLLPESLDNQNTIQDVSFRNAGLGMFDEYGGISENNRITCLYSYPTNTGIPYALIMISK